MSATDMAPELQTREWLNTDKPISLADLRGKVVCIEAFQMLCPGCVSHGIPQAMRVAETFDASRVAVIGLHTVFEHHEAQGTKAALAAFLHEYRIPFPVGIDLPGEETNIPCTMAAYGMQGTPTVILVDQVGHRRFQQFGGVSDMAIAAQIMSLLKEAPEPANPASGA